MKLVIQRVKKANVKVNDEIIANINKGLLVFIGFKKDDLEKDLDWFAEKIIKLRIFDDREGKMNLAIKDIDGEILLVSQFTLYGDAKQNRPSFIEAMDSENAKKLYEKFFEKVKLKYSNTLINADKNADLHGIDKVQTGVFGAMMDIELLNDGPITIIMEND